MQKSEGFALLIPEPAADTTKVNRRKLPAHLDRTDNKSQDFFLRLMESFIQYRSTPRE